MATKKRSAGKANVQKAMWFADSPEPLFKSRDFPQADRLAMVRHLVAAVESGIQTHAGLVDALKLDTRHVSYYQRAATILGLLEEFVADAKTDPVAVNATVSKLGRELIGTKVGSKQEREQFLAAITSSSSLRPFRSFFEGQTVSKKDLAFRIQTLSDLALSTATRRAGTFVAWRNYLAPKTEKKTGKPVIDDVTAELKNIVETHNASVKERWIAWLKTVHPSVFEELVGELVVAMGYDDVEVTGRPGDGGVDVRASKTDQWDHTQPIAIQVKRYGKNVQGHFIDQMIGVMHRERLSEAYVVTTSGFAPAAISAADQVKGMRLIDGAMLVDKLAEHSVGLRHGKFGELLAISAVEED